MSCIPPTRQASYPDEIVGSKAQQTMTSEFRTPDQLGFPKPADRFQPAEGFLNSLADLERGAVCLTACDTAVDRRVASLSRHMRLHAKFPTGVSEIPAV